MLSQSYEDLKNVLGKNVLYTVALHYLKLGYLKVPFCITEYRLDTFPIFLYIKTAYISNYWCMYHKVNFLTTKLILRYKYFETNFDVDS